MSILYYLFSSVFFITILTQFFPCQIYGISLIREKELRNYWPKIFEPKEDKDKYEWWREKLLIDGFNESCKNTTASYLKVEDEFMIEIRFRTIENGNLPHLSYIFCNPDPLGSEFNTLTCSVTGALLLI